MNIALLAPLWKRVPPEKYGGSELVVANLAKGLVALGHRVSTFASADSAVTGTLIPVIPRPMHELIGVFDWRGIQQYEFLSFFEFAKRAGDFDVVHNHMGFHPNALAPLLPIPMVTTLHSSMPPDFPVLAEAFREQPFVSISDAQRVLAPALHYIATIHHGIEVDSFMHRAEGIGNGFVFLGTLSRSKGIDIAIRTARALGARLTIAGDIREDDRGFLDSDVFPLIDNKTIHFVGEVGHEEKNRLLRDADALLFPSRWNEAFGLVMIEALACGTPVVALASGAVPEVLRDGVTGFIVENEAAFIKAASNISRLSRAVARKEAEERFDLSHMAKKYIEVYRSLIKVYHQ
ncbi:MAG TPA: glycosyltransferase family 4 protein [Candidatus Paceibacterota bacterium]